MPMHMTCGAAVLAVAVALCSAVGAGNRYAALRASVGPMGLCCVRVSRDMLFG